MSSDERRSADYERKRERLEQLLRERAGASAQPRVIEAPLTSQQQRLWFFEELQPGTPVFNVGVVLRLTGPVNAAALERALGVIIRRHGVFRTRIAVRDGTPLQVVEPELQDFHLEIIDLSTIADAERAAAAEQLVDQIVRQPFDLARAPLFRARLVRLSDTDHYFVMPMHHLICDGWSVQILVRELRMLYAAYVMNSTCELPRLERQYADLARRQQALLNGDEFRAHLEYWKKHLAGAPKTTELPTDFPRLTEQVTAGATEIRMLSPELRDRVRQLAREQGTTLFMAMQAAFKCLLVRLTGQEDLVLGSPVAGRTSDAEPVIGCFINHVVYRTDLGGDPSFAEALQRVKATALGAYAHQDVPFDKIVEHLQPERDPGRPPLFQIQFNMTLSPGTRIEFPGFVAEPLWLADDWAKFDLSVFFIEFEQGVTLRVVYNAGLYAQATVLALMDRFEQLLEQVADDPLKPISAYSLLIGAEQDSLVDAFSGKLE